VRIFLKTGGHIDFNAARRARIEVDDRLPTSNNIVLILDDDQGKEIARLVWSELVGYMTII
jgi:hypothetical protein